VAKDLTYDKPHVDQRVTVLSQISALPCHQSAIQRQTQRKSSGDLRRQSTLAQRARQCWVPLFLK
jgi:hypothetical protein